MKARPSFADVFHRLAGPPIRQRIDVNGTFVAVGLMTIAEAEADVTAFAMRLGASHLPEMSYRAFMVAVPTALAERVESLRKQVAEEMARVDGWGSEHPRAWAIAARILSCFGYPSP